MCYCEYQKKETERTDQFFVEALNLIKHNEATLTSRANFFLLAESFLVAVAISNDISDFLRFVLSVLAFVISLYWWRWGDRFLGNTKILIQDLKETCCNTKNNVLTTYFEWRDRSRHGSSEIFGKVLPDCFLTFWVFLLFYSLLKLCVYSFHIFSI